MIDSNRGRRVAIVGLALVWLYTTSATPAQAEECASQPDGASCASDQGRCFLGQCLIPPLSCSVLSDWSPCDAGQGPSTGRCMNGTCLPLSTLLPCPAQVCRWASFDPGTLGCQYTLAPEGAACTSSSGAGVCQDGVCVAASLVCQPGEFYLNGVCIRVTDVCAAALCQTAVSYDPATAVCEYASQSDGAACSSPGGEGACVGGQCVEPSALGVTELLIRLDFAAPAPRDTILLKATIGVPDGFSAAGAQVLVDVGGVVKSFHLDATGRAIADTDQVKLAVASTQGVVLAQDAKLSVKFANGSFASQLADEGLTNATVTELPVSIPIRLVLSGAAYATTQPQIYTAKAGKVGKAK